LRERTLRAARTRDDADRRAALRIERGELTARELEDGLLRLAHNDRGGSRRADELPAIPGVRLHVVHEGPFRDRAEGERVPAVDVVPANGHDLADLESVRRDHEDLEAPVLHPRDRSCPARGVLDGRDGPFARELRMVRDPRMAVARGPVRGRSAPAPSLLRQLLSPQYTPLLS